MSQNLILMNLIIAAFFTMGASAEGETGQPITTIKEVKPYRTFLTIKNYNLENSGKPGNGIVNARLEITFANGNKVELPENGHYWPIGNGQSQEVNRTFEIPWSLIQSDGTHFTVQIVRSGATIAPCVFAVDQISLFNRGYVCHTDAMVQAEQKIPADRIVKESVQIRVFSDRNLNPSEVPKDAIALRQ